MENGAAGVHNQPLLSRFLRDGDNTNVTPITKAKREHATIMQASYDAKIQPQVLDELHTSRDHTDHGQVAEIEQVVGARTRQKAEHLHVFADPQSANERRHVMRHNLW